MQQTFDFDYLCRLAQQDPAAFEAQRHAIFESALAEMPAELQAGARTRLAQVQVRMAGARDPAGRLALSFSALGDTLAALQQGFVALAGDIRAATARGSQRCRQHTDERA